MEPELCPICYDTITNKLSISCNHSFCSECIIKWFRHGNPQCPVCRDAPEMEKSDTESEPESDIEDTYQDDVNNLINNIKTTVKLHPHSKELKQKVKECKEIRKNFKVAVKERIQKSIQIELNKIPKKKKELFEEVKKMKGGINKACVASAKKVEQDSISKNRIKYFVKNKVNRIVFGNNSRKWSFETLSNRLEIPKELNLIPN